MIVVFLIGSGLEGLRYMALQNDTRLDSYVGYIGYDTKGVAFPGLAQK